MSKDIEKELLDILPTVSKPGRYIGEEWNSEKKNPDGKLRIALAFPDTYEIGMSYLGIKILYHLLNNDRDIYCERVFAPWIDLEEALQKRGIPLFSLETKTPLNQFDIVAFSINYELNYTNVLNMLKLGGIPLRRDERKGSDPFILGGGPSLTNPLPLSEFFDAFFIGEGEVGILEIAELAKRYLGKERRKDKLLEELGKVESIFLPETKRPQLVKKRFVCDLNSSFYPTKQIVPLIEVVHDRISLEIMRGCPNRCRFCQASALGHPLRIRSCKKIVELAKETYRATGYEEVSLLSLSSGEHPDIVNILESLVEEFKKSA